MQSTGKATPEAAASEAAEPGTPGLASADFAEVSGFLDFFFFNVRSRGGNLAGTGRNVRGKQAPNSVL
jgi:hypothetical protein